jgi:hypothetical protein
MCCWPLYYYKPVSLQSAKILYYKPVSMQSAKTLYYKPVSMQSARILWGRLPTCGRLLIGPLLDRDATAVGDCIKLSQRRIANPPQIRQPAPQLQEQLQAQVQVHKLAVRMDNVGTPWVYNG